MRARILGIFVPVLAVSAIVGTGFAIFQFGGGAENSLEITGEDVSLAGYSEIGDITIKNADYAQLSIDSSEDGGIHLVYGSGASGAQRDRIDFSFGLTQDEAREAELSLTTTVEFASSLGAYISLEAQNGDSSGKMGTSQTKNPATSALTWTDTLDTSDANETFDLHTDLTLGWAEGEMPTNSASWNALKSAIDALSGEPALTITYSVDFA